MMKKSELEAMENNIYEVKHIQAKGEKRPILRLKIGLKKYTKGKKLFVFTKSELESFMNNNNYNEVLEYLKDKKE
jgi:hypothetical protein